MGSLGDRKINLLKELSDFNNEVNQCFIKFKSLPLKIQSSKEFTSNKFSQEKEEKKVHSDIEIKEKWTNYQKLLKQLDNFNHIKEYKIKATYFTLWNLVSSENPNIETPSLLPIFNIKDTEITKAQELALEQFMDSQN